MNDPFILYAFQGLITILLAVVAFMIKGVFARMDYYGKRINKLEVDMARNTSENETLFKRLDGIEKKLDRILEGEWRRSKNS
jgi:hypothetical protein